MRALTLILAALLFAGPAAAQQTPVDSLRAELVRSRGFIRAADTQLSKTLALLDSILASLQVTPPDTTVPEPPAPPVEPEPDPPVIPDPPAGASLVEEFDYASFADFLAAPHFEPWEDKRTDQMRLENGALRYIYPAGSGTDFTITRSIALGSLQEVWVEAVISWDPHFTINGSGQSAGSAQKLLHVGIRGPSGRFGLGLNGSRINSEGPSDNYDAFYQWGTATVSELLDGQPHVIRYHIRLGSPALHEFWVDGVFQGRREAATSTSSLRSIALARNLNKMPPTEQSMYWHRVSVWTQDPGW